MCVVLESHVRDSNLQRLCSHVFGHWDWTSNGAWCHKGTRIIMGWNRNDVDVVVIDQDDQVIHTRIWLKKDKKEVFCSFIYAHNKYTQRRSLWRSLCKHKVFIRNRPWTIMGDFNASLFIDESTASGSKVDINMREFRNCIEEIEFSDVQGTGLQFTWNQKPKGGLGILKKLDRIMANVEFRDQFMGAHAIFKPYRVSDHSPSVLCIPTLGKSDPKPFKFFNVLTSHDSFLEVVKAEWDRNISGFYMYRVVKKLKNLKKPFRKLLYEKGNLHVNVNRLRADLDALQVSIDADPFNVTLRDREAACIAEFNQAVLMEERFLKQKAKIQWLKEGDSNSAYFHKMVKSRVSRSRIDVITNTEGDIFENDTVPNAFVNHYEMFLGLAGQTSTCNSLNLFKACLNDQEALEMVREVSDKEVKDAMFSMGDDKSPGPDGFTAAFFKEAWSIIGNDVIAAVREFFRNGTILKELNHTIITLIPKVKSPSRVNDYRPISCCNVLFKCISKIIANRIKHCLKSIVSPNQSAFVPGRSITDNILLTQELMHNYHLDRGPPRCAFKVDIQKAYDTVDWNFLRMTLHGFGFHETMVSWIMECVSSTSYSICINGSLHGFFKGKRGLRQGDPLSPYLFTLVMEVLTLMLQRRVQASDCFTYHRYCSKLDLINLCFADDLFLFAYGDVNSASIIKDTLDEFKNVSGLVPSIPKSTAYFCNVLNHVKLAILHVLPFEEGRLPVKYLGVPLVSSRLMVRDCNELVDKVQLCVQDWKNKALSIAGRLQLIQSVLGSKHIYWASVFTLPTSVLLNIEQILRHFLWCHGSSGKGKSKVAWEIVCLPKEEGGLGIRRLECFNLALMATHVWKLLILKDSLWVKWIHEYKLKGRSFWDYPLRGNMSWGWRKILSLRPIIRRFIWSKVGNGNTTSIWYDQWSTLEPLAHRVSSRDIVRSGLTLQSKVSDIVVNGSWSWPVDLLSKYPFLSNYNTPINDDVDRLVWSDSHGNIKKFSVAQVWSDIRSRDTKVNWYSMVWFPSCIPRHAINLWLIIRRKLKTQDLIPSWDVSNNLGSVCSLCESIPDSHDHIFFECIFARSVWNRLKGLAGLDSSNCNIYVIIQDLLPYVKSRTTRCVIAKLVVAASAYYVWQERNWRLFQKGKRSIDQVVECIKSVVRLKLLSCKLKKSKSGERLAKLWDLPEAVFV
ncbi:putative RNA-directed DNA polymerase [Tanacetum coccineum]